MGRRQQKAAQCGKKVRYESEADAARGMANLKKARNVHANAYKLRVYRCAWCSMWHFGHVQHSSKRNKHNGRR